MFGFQDYFELKDITIIILTDSRTYILMKNTRESVRNMKNDIDFLKNTCTRILKEQKFATKTKYI